MFTEGHGDGGWRVGWGERSLSLFGGGFHKTFPCGGVRTTYGEENRTAGERNSQGEDGRNGGKWLMGVGLEGNEISLWSCDWRS
jgi:hypothetical protein